MKNIKILSLLWVILITWTLAGCWNKDWDFIIEDASAVINYNDNLVDTASACIASENIIRDTYDNENSSIEDIKTAINNTIEECTTAKKNIKSIWDWEWDSSLKDWILNIIEKYITYYSKFSEVLPYLEQEEITEDQNTKYESLLAEIETLDNELNIANQNLINIQQEFANKYWFELEASEEDTNDETYNEEAYVPDEISYEETTENEEIEEVNEDQTEETTEDQMEEVAENEIEE